MGNKLFESNPTIIGPEQTLLKNEQNYFNRVNAILHKRYRANLYSDYNLAVSLEQKSFENNQVIQPKLEDISWLDYIFRHLDFVISKNNKAIWAIELKNALSKEIFLFENKYFSNFFYNEYYISTNQNKLGEKENALNDISTDINNQSIISLNNSVNISTNNGYNELDVTDNFGGSYLEMNIENLDPNDPTFQYKMKRKNVKKYIKILKEHIYNNQQHPINITVNLFVKYFCKYINTNIDNFNKQLKNQFLNEENFAQNINNFDNEITQSLRKFIIAMHCSLKLFYSTCINFVCFEEEKDDIINLLTSLFFKTGKLYESIYSLYSQSYNNNLKQLQEKFNDLSKVKPKDLGVQIKFCLDEDTLEFQRNILKEKQIEKDNDNNKMENMNQSDKKDNQLFQIKENEEEEKDNDDDNDKNNNNIMKELKFNMNNMNILNNIDEYNIDKDDDDYLLEKINDDISIDTKLDAVSGGLIHLRNTVNSFNNKKYLFPKIRKNLRDTLALNDKYIREAKASGKMPMPYYSAVNLLKNLKNFKTPFEKIVILASLSDQITESVSTFWCSMMKYIKNSLLFIEADEIMAIFVFIVIKSQMPDLFIETKIITNFTTPSTRAFNISYNLTLLEASLETISKMDNIKEIGSREKQLKEVRKSIAVLTTQRLSRLSRISNPGSPFA
jgi:hypothetical protein